MDEENKNALVPRPSGAIEKAVPGVKRILSGMVTDALALASREQRALTPSKFRIGDYEWCEPDYRQILIWSEETGLKPEEVIARLLDQQSLRESWFGSPSAHTFFEEPLFANGRLLKVNFDLRLLRCGRLEWVNGLEITHLRFMAASDLAWLSDLGPLPLARLVSLTCREVGLTRLNLTRVSRLKYLDCSTNRLKELQLHCAPQLTWLECDENELTELKFDQTPNLSYLGCSANRLTRLDLSGLVCLERVFCGENKLTELELTDLVNLKGLHCWETCLCELDLAEVPELGWLDCPENQISELYLSQCPKLWNLVCYRNRLTRLDLSSVQELKYLNCSDNAISELDLSSCPNLVRVDCSGNPISVLDIRGLEHLQELTRGSHMKVIMNHEQEHTVKDFLRPPVEQDNSKKTEMTDSGQNRFISALHTNTGLAYLYGRGVPKDALEAYKWFKVAAEQGNKDAAEKLASLASTLSPDELQGGERRYRDFKASRKN